MTLSKTIAFEKLIPGQAFTVLGNQIRFTKISGASGSMNAVDRAGQYYQFDAWNEVEIAFTPVAAAEPVKPNKLTLADLEAEIASEHHFTAAHGAATAPFDAVFYADREQAGEIKHTEVPDSLSQVTFCVIVLRNGHKVVGINYGPVDPAEFSAEDGRRYAREDAISKLWEPLGFRLRDELANARPALTAADAAADLAGTPRPDFGKAAGHSIDRAEQTGA